MQSGRRMVSAHTQQLFLPLEMHLQTMLSFSEMYLLWIPIEF